ncbi:oxysterol-binding protein (macronuclear) [Tetrahymena thermophila SB210]|uniref:Oxysterol-binding protein n=1 Tax=Tetrahymena thermophila (strain SB210) TaxID=312017 RepID=Q22BR7_TETTS|nr:oxysterol-binding protein [Tetrahymena thermophila SB210]EAR82722.2 oxysterol-binding protein [Tetrahymena thermophila SB210]|eukprot:XP_001030385.2 oxysterol-binding protein [Tetrahymena thermophila SB210]
MNQILKTLQENEIYEEGKAYPYHKCRLQKGGFKMNYVEDNSTRAVMVNVLKQIGVKLYNGEISNAMQISRPAAMCTSLSVLECIAHDHVYTDFLKEAASSDPLRQMQLVCAHMISGLHYNSSKLFTKAPLEPTLGETLQLQKSDGTKFLAEQICQNPPIASVIMIGPDNCYRQYHSHQVKVNLNKNLNSLVGRALGEQTFQFKDSEIVSELAEIHIDGLLVGDRAFHYKGKVELLNKKQNLKAVINFNYQSEGHIAKISNTISSLFGGSKKKNENVLEKDSFDISIYKISQNGNQKDNDDCQACISKGNGNWLAFLQFDGKLFWKIDDHNETWSPDEKLLSSDSTFRLDRQLIQKNKIEEAQKEKIRIEAEDQKFKKLRSSSKK